MNDITRTSKDLCEHDWVGDDYCAYCDADAARDMLTDARLELDALRAALGVDYEPHQSLHERMLDAANHKRVDRTAHEPPPALADALAYLTEARRYIECDPIAEERGVLSNYDDALAAIRASQPPTDDTRRLDALEAWLSESKAKGFAWDSRCFDTDKTIREQIDRRLGTTPTKPACDCEGPQKIGPDYHAPYCATMAGTEFAKRYAPADETGDGNAN